MNYEDTRLRLLDVSAQQVGCLQVMLEQLFVTLRLDLASVADDPARAVERTVSVAEQRYRDCLEVYGAAREKALRPSSPLADAPRRDERWGVAGAWRMIRESAAFEHPDVDGFDPCDPSGGAA